MEVLVNFEIGDYAVCPGHGVGQVIDLETKELSGEAMSFYMIKILANGMTVMVPTSSENGARHLVGDREISQVYDLLKDHDVELDTSTWNRRYRDYMLKIKTGSIIEIADVLRALFLLKARKSLSFGEKKMLEQCRDFVAQEIAITTKEEQKKINSEIEECFN